MSGFEAAGGVETSPSINATDVLPRKVKLFSRHEMIARWEVKEHVDFQSHDHFCRLWLVAC